MQSVHIYTDESKGRSEEVAKALDVSLNQIDTYQSDGGRKFLLGQTTDSGVGGVAERLSSELKNVSHVSFFYHILN